MALNNLKCFYVNDQHLQPNPQMIMSSYLENNILLAITYFLSGTHLQLALIHSFGFTLFRNIMKKES